jgi:hypothetical protein
MARKRYAKPGDLQQLRTVMWQAILDTKALTDAPSASPEQVLKVGHCLAQLAGAYTKLVETAEIAERVAMLETAMQTRRT